MEFGQNKKDFTGHYIFPHLYILGLCRCISIKCIASDEDQSCRRFTIEKYKLSTANQSDLTFP